MAEVYWKTLTLKVPEEVLEQLEEYASDHGFESLSAAARFALTAGLGKRAKQDIVEALRNNAKAEAFHLLDTLLDDLKGRFTNEYVP